MRREQIPPCTVSGTFFEVYGQRYNPLEFINNRLVQEDFTANSDRPIRFRRGPTSGRLYALLILLFGIALASITVSCAKRRKPQKSNPERVITLTPSATELTLALGAGERLVAVDRYSRIPDELGPLPSVGDFLGADVPAILRLKPDLVVVDAAQRETADSLERSGIATLVLPMHTVSDVKSGLDALGEVLGETERARAAVGRIDAAIRGAGERARSRPPVAVLAIVDRQAGSLRGIVAAGPGSYLDELLSYVGADNALADARVRYPKTTADTILRRQPDVILDASTHDAGDWSALAQARAVSAGRVHGIGDKVYLSPSPAVGRALEGLEALLFAQQSGDDQP